MTIEKKNRQVIFTLKFENTVYFDVTIPIAILGETRIIEVNERIQFVVKTLEIILRIE